MKANIIILFLVLQSFVSVVLSQNIQNGFDIQTKENTTWFRDVNASQYKGYPENNRVGRLSDPLAKFSTLENFKKIEQEIFSEDERTALFANNYPMIFFTIRANDGKIVAVTFTFDDLPNISLIDTRKLAKFRIKVINEIMYEDLQFNGQKATSGYMMQGMRLFKP